MPDAFEPGRTLPARSLDFWFDYTCPFAYLGSTQALALAARMGVPLTYRPMLLGGVFRVVGTPQNLSEVLAPPKAAHNTTDMQRWAKRFGVTLRMPPNHPMRSVEALRATLATADTRTGAMDPAVIRGFYRAYWVDNRDLGQREVVADVVAQAGHDPRAVLEAVATPAIKDDLRRRTDEAISLGIFGVPTFIVDGQHLYWGQDRLAFVEGVRRAPCPPAHAPGEAPRGARAVVEAYWDFSSPFAYLGMSQVDALAARTGATIVSRPILLGGLFRSMGTPDVPLATFSEAKQRYIAKDLDRWAAWLGVPFRFPTRFPMNSLRALRVYLALPEGRRAAYRDAVFRAYWAEDRDLTDDRVLASCIGDEEVARHAFERANSDAVKAELRSTTERAAAEGVFGVPTFVVTRGERRELFWGQDRLGLVEDAVRGE